MTLDDPAYRHILSRPPDSPLGTRYELLGVAHGESDPAVLEQAMLDCVIKVRRYQVGAYQAHAVKLLNELGEAYVCLTDDDTRRQYERSIGIGPRGSPGDTRTLDADVVVDDAAHRPAQPTRLPRASKPLEPTPTSEADATQSRSPAADTCPQCGKPMSSRLTTCYHCNYRRSATLQSPTGQEATRSAPLFDAGEMVRQDITPEQMLARFNLMRDMYQAKKLSRKFWVSTQPNLCQRCNHKLATSNDAHAITIATLSRLSEFIVQFARRQQGLGQHFDWPLSKEAIDELQEEIVGRKPQAVRLYCRNCAEKLFRSPRLE